MTPPETHKYNPRYLLYIFELITLVQQHAMYYYWPHSLSV